MAKLPAALLLSFCRFHLTRHPKDLRGFTPVAHRFTHPLRELIAGPKNYGPERVYAVIRDPAGACCALYQG